MREISNWTTVNTDQFWPIISGRYIPDWSKWQINSVCKQLHLSSVIVRVWKCSVLTKPVGKWKLLLRKLDFNLYWFSDYYIQLTIRLQLEIWKESKVSYISVASLKYQYRFSHWGTFRLSEKSFPEIHGVDLWQV